MNVISNSSPLINFATIGRFDLLRSLYETISIPHAVYAEVVTAGPGEPGAVEVEQAAWIVRKTVNNVTAVQALHGLGLGEAEAIILAVESPEALLILDDRRGRLAAGRLGVTVIGTLGVLLLAKRKGLLKMIAPEIDALHTQNSFRIGPQLRINVLQEAGEPLG